MRVLHVYKSYYPDSVGGIEQVIAQLGMGLASLGDESRIYTLSANPVPAVLRRAEGEVHRSKITAEIASNPISISALYEFRRQVQWADVVHYQFPWPFADVLHLLDLHLTLTKQEAVARLQKDWLADVKAFDDIFVEAMTIADAISAGIVKKFPDRFTAA